MKSCLYDDKGISSMRVFFILIVFFAGLLSVSMSFHIIWNTVNNKEVSWAEMSVFLGGITAFTTATAWQKVEQKKIEVEQQKNEANDN